MTRGTNDIEYEQYRKLEATMEALQAEKGGSLSLDDGIMLLTGLLANIRARLIRLESKETRNPLSAEQEDG